MIKAIEIEGFRSLRSVRFELRPFNVLIGPNQSGKTNILDALDLLSRGAQGQLARSLYQSRGGFANLLWAGDSPRQIRYRLEFEPTGRFPEQDGSVAYGLSIVEQAQGHVIAEETVDVGPRPGEDNALNVFMRKRGQDFIALRGTDRASHVNLGLPRSFDQQELAIGINADATAYAAVGKVRDALASITIYPGFVTKARWTYDQPNDTPQIRQPQFVQHATLLEPNGDNLVNVLYTLSQDEDRWKDFKEVVRIGFPDFENIQFPAAGQGRISLAWSDRRFRGRKFSAEELSDGTLSFLALAATLASSDRPTLIAFDEPERHLHPELLYRAVGLMEQASANRQIIVATHSDAFLSYLTDPTSVVLVNNGPQGTTLTRPTEDDLREWLKDYTLAQLREDGFLAAFARTGG